MNMEWKLPLTSPQYAHVSCDTYVSLMDLTIKAASQREAEFYISLIEKMIPEIKVGFSFLYKKRDYSEEE